MQPYPGEQHGLLFSLYYLQLIQVKLKPGEGNYLCDQLLPLISYVVSNKESQRTLQPSRPWSEDQV